MFTPSNNSPKANCHKAAFDGVYPVKFRQRKFNRAFDTNLHKLTLFQSANSSTHIQFLKNRMIIFLATYYMLLATY